MRAIVTDVVATPFVERGCPDCSPTRGRELDLSSIPPRLRRSTSVHQRLVLDLFARLVPPEDRAHVPIVHGSAFAELETAVALARSDEPSPARFTTSVHSSATGIACIAYGNRLGHVTLSAGADTISLCLLEAMGRLASGGTDVVVLVADETSDALPHGDEQAFGLGLRLSSRSTRGGRAIRLEPSVSSSEAAGTLHASARALQHALLCSTSDTRLLPRYAGSPTIHVESGGLDDR